MLEPFDGANKVRLPDGQECFEKEHVTYGANETFHTFQYSVDTDAYALDYDGRVEELEIWDEETATWNLVVNYFPVTTSMVSRLREVINGGWAKHSELLVPGDVDEGVVMPRMMNAKGYLEIYTEVMDAIMGYQRGSLDV